MTWRRIKLLQLKQNGQVTVCHACLTRAWKAAAKRRDVLAVAQPGSGKTLAYLLSMAARLMSEPHAAEEATLANSAFHDDHVLPAPRGLVLVPTRWASLDK